MRDGSGGYRRFQVGSTRVVAAAHLADNVREILRTRTLHGYAREQAQARALPGRGVAFAVPIGSEHAVVRHNRHGGLLAPLTGDLFLVPTRAPLELRIAQQLQDLGVRTPTVLAIAVYPVALVWARADVVTREVPDSFDLGHGLMLPDAAARLAALTSAALLIRGLGRARVRHEDLNVKNLLLSGQAPHEAWLLDVDRVRLSVANATEHNLQRLLRSARRWQAERGAKVTEGELSRFQQMCLDNA